MHTTLSVHSHNPSVAGGQQIAAEKHAQHHVADECGLCKVTPSASVLCTVAESCSTVRSIHTGVTTVGSTCRTAVIVNNGRAPPRKIAVNRP